MPGLTWGGTTPGPPMTRTINYDAHKEDTWTSLTAFSFNDLGMGNF